MPHSCLRAYPPHRTLGGAWAWGGSADDDDGEGEREDVEEDTTPEIVSDVFSFIVLVFFVFFFQLLNELQLPSGKDCVIFLIDCSPAMLAPFDGEKSYLMRCVKVSFFRMLLTWSRLHTTLSSKKLWPATRILLGLSCTARYERESYVVE